MATIGTRRLAPSRDQSRNIAIGAAVLVLGAALLVVAYGGGARVADGGYPVTARFNRADGLEPGAEVRLSGMRIGRVEAQDLDPHYRAVVRMRIQSGVQLPTDTSAAVHTNGLLGDKYIELEPGADEDYLKAGGEIAYTQDSLVVEDLLEMIIARAKAERDGANRAR